MSEKDLINRVMLQYTNLGHRLFRQNTGLGWAGKFIKHPMETVIRVTPNDVVVKNARPLHAGLCKGSSDLIGWKQVTITQEMVGKTVAIFTAIECKAGSTKTTPEQENFIKKVRESGGEGLIIRDNFDMELMS